MNPVAASIITIGDELLIGQTIDTNSSWMAAELNKAGITVTRRVAVGDDHGQIWKALDEESLHADIILLTGGLGPTADDITKPLLCEYFNGKMVVNEEKKQFIIHLFTEVLKRPLLERNLKQAEVPDTCTVLQNTRGTAPGMWFEKEGKIFVSMPGVPYEMKGLMTEEVIPRLSKRFPLPPVLHRNLVTSGIGESFLAERIKNFEESLPAFLKLAYLPNFGMVKLRLSTLGSAGKQEEAALDEYFHRLEIMLSDVRVASEDIPIQEIVIRLLLENKQTIATAESCTGGFIAHLLTLRPGVSAVFNGSVVSYSNEAKMDVLHVKPATLQEYGAVSEPTVAEMVTGALDAFKTDYAIATSGIMGPEGATPGKPVGTVCIGTGNRERTVTRTYQLRYDRERNIEQTAVLALNQVRNFILEKI